MADTNLDYQFGILCLFILGLLVLLLLPVAEPPREGTPTEDARHTRRQR